MVNASFTANMLFSKDITLEDRIVLLLQSGPLSTDNLLACLQKVRIGTTKQGMYRVLRILIRSDIVVKSGRIVSLSVAWVERVSSLTNAAEGAYLRKREGSVLDLEEGDSIRYSFRNTNVAEAFWNHTNHVLVKAHPRTPWFGYNPHCWFFLADPARERGFRDLLVKQGGQYLMTVGGDTSLDRAIKGEFDGKGSQYHRRQTPLFAKNNYYLNIIGDYVIEAWLAPTHARAIEQLYQNTSDTHCAQQKLLDIINSKGRTRLVVSRNSKKAATLRGKLGRVFYVSRI
jgi:hypothetical protein